MTKLINEHLRDVLNAVVLKVGDGHVENINNRVMTIRARGRGFRNTERLRNTFYFHLDGLNLRPDGVSRFNAPARFGEDPHL